jgi:hypothetical protein
MLGALAIALGVRVVVGLGWNERANGMRRGEGAWEGRP